MTAMSDRQDVIDRLSALGDVMELHDPHLVDGVLDEVADAGRRRRRVARRLGIVAAALIAIVVAGLAHPSGREAMARWFGLAGATVEVDPAVSTAGASEPFAVPGPGDSEVVVVEGREVLFSVVDGRLADGLITKTVQSSDQISDVEVAGRPGLWIAAGGHQVAYAPRDGEVAVVRVAANTLLWQDGPLLLRVEGFDDLADALAFAVGT